MSGSTGHGRQCVATPSCRPKCIDQQQPVHFVSGCLGYQMLSLSDCTITLTDLQPRTNASHLLRVAHFTQRSRDGDYLGQMFDVVNWRRMPRLQCRVESIGCGYGIVFASSR